MVVLLDKLMFALKSLQSLLEQKISAVSSLIVNPDWNQNDPVANDYIKNRPFYTDGEIVKIEEKYFPDYLAEEKFVAINEKLNNTTTSVEQINTNLDSMQEKLNSTTSNIEQINTNIEDIEENIGRTVIIAEGNKEDNTYTQYFMYRSDLTPDIGTIIGSKVFGKNFTYYINEDDITEYDWGYNFTYGIVLVSGSVTIDEHSYSNPGLYMGTYYYDLTDGIMRPYYRPYGIELYYKIDSKYIPPSQPVTAIILKSTTDESTKKFKITVDDTGTLSATEV